MYPPNPQQPGQPSNPQWPPQPPPSPQWGPSQPLPPGQQFRPPAPPPTTPYPGRPMQQSPGYQPQHPGQMQQPPMPPKKPMPRWQKILIALAIVFIGIPVAINGAVQSFNNQTAKATATASQPTQAAQPTEKPAPTPTATPIPEKVLFSKDGQTAGLALNDSEAFELKQGKIKIEYSCQRSFKDGVDVQFNVALIDNEGFIDKLAWAIRLECPDSGTAEADVAPGKYKVTVATGGDIGWSMKVSQS